MSYGVTTFRVVAKGLAVKTVAFARSLLDETIINLDPSEVILEAGKVTIVGKFGSDDSDPFDFLMVPQNKVVDVILYLSFLPGDRSTVFSFAREPADLSDEDRGIVLDAKVQQLCATYLTYILHGSLGNLGARRPVVPNFLHLVFGSADTEYQISELCTFASAEKLKFPGLHENAGKILRSAPLTLQSRSLLGLGGNRPVAIAKHYKSAVKGKEFEFDQVALLFTSEVLGGHPYISLLPEHSANPMHNGSKLLLAAMGKELRRMGVDTSPEALKAENKGLFIDPVIGHLNAKYTGDGSDLPDLDDMLIAFTDRFSLPAILKP